MGVWARGTRRGTRGPSRQPSTSRRRCAVPAHVPCDDLDWALIVVGTAPGNGTVTVRMGTVGSGTDDVNGNGLSRGTRELVRSFVTKCLNALLSTAAVRYSFTVWTQVSGV